MEIKVLSQTKNKVRFVVKGTSPSELNAYRRGILETLPAMAVDTVEIVENSSAMYDEMLAHRLGLVVLTTDLDSYFVQADCKCEGAGCARCTLDLTLEKEGPCVVYAEDLVSKDPAVTAAQPKTPLVKLLEGQNIKLMAKAILGRGKEHIKFSSGLLYYQGYPKITVKNVSDPQGVASVCPTQVFSADAKSLKVKDIDACTLCMACVDASDKAVNVEGSSQDFIVTLEPWGQIPAKKMVHHLVEEIHTELDAVSAAFAKK